MLQDRISTRVQAWKSNVFLKTAEKNILINFLHCFSKNRRIFVNILSPVHKNSRQNVNFFCHSHLHHRTIGISWTKMGANIKWYAVYSGLANIPACNSVGRYRHALTYPRHQNREQYEHECKVCTLLSGDAGGANISACSSAGRCGNAQTNRR